MAYKAQGIEGLGAESKAIYEALKKEYATLSDEKSRYEMGVISEADAAPSEELALMEALARRSFMERQAAQPSNVAAQFAMVLDPNFAPVFKDATTSHINAARQYFGDLGTIARESRSEKAGRASSRKWSDARLRSIGDRIKLFEGKAADLDIQKARNLSRQYVARISAQSRNRGRKIKLHDTGKRVQQLEKQLLATQKAAGLSREEMMFDAMGLAKIMGTDAGTPQQEEAKKQAIRIWLSIKAHRLAASTAGSNDVTGEQLEAARKAVSEGLMGSSSESGSGAGQVVGVPTSKSSSFESFSNERRWEALGAQ